MSGRKRRAPPSAELAEVAATTSMALTFQLLAATATIRLTATAANGSRPTLILNPWPLRAMHLEKEIIFKKVLIERSRVNSSECNTRGGKF